MSGDSNAGSYGQEPPSQRVGALVSSGEVSAESPTPHCKYHTKAALLEIDATLPERLAAILTKLPSRSKLAEAADAICGIERDR